MQVKKNIFKKQFSRRTFLKGLGLAALTLSASPFLNRLFLKRNLKKAHAAIGEKRGLREASYYKKIDEKYVQCTLCPRGCTLTDGQRSFCRVREPIDGKLYTLVFGLPCAVHVDPIENKPLFHVLPATSSFSVATAGCNLRCKFCQNWQISQKSPEETENVLLNPQQTVEMAKKTNSKSIAYTYTEPTVFYEYMIETAKIAKSEGLINLYHSGGFINPKPLAELTKYLNAANVDLKGFNKEYLKQMCQEDLRVVLNTLKTLKENGVWLEITNLVVPTFNDKMSEIRQMCEWIKENLGSEVPLHFSRFWPQYKLKNLHPTPVQTLQWARKTALDVGLSYVYIGNVPGNDAENTYCPSCKKVLIERKGYRLGKNNIKSSRCKFCGYPIAGIWSQA